MENDFPNKIKDKFADKEETEAKKTIRLANKILKINDKNRKIRERIEILKQLYNIILNSS